MNTIALSVGRTLLVALATLILSVPTLCAQEGNQDDASTINVAVLNLEGDGVDAKLLETLTAVLRNEAQQHGGYDIVNQSPINLSEIVVVLGCDTNNPQCLEQAADQLDARVLIYGRVEKVEQAHKVTIEVFNTTSGTSTQRLVHTLTNEADPVVAFRRQIQSMFNPDAAGETTQLTIGASITGAKIRLNDTMIGTAPLERKGLPPGTYEVEVYQDGYASWRTSVELSEGSDVRLWAPLEKTPGADQSPGAVADSGTSIGDADELGSSSPPPMSGVGSGPNWGAWSAIGVGGLAVGGSLAFAGLMGSAEDDLVAHDARRSELNRDDYIAQREDIVDTGESYELAHRVLLGVGAASIIAGTVWLWVDDDEVDELMAEAPAWDVAVSPTGARALVRW
jgi:hypothetical protein